MKYMTTAQAAKEWGISQRRIALLCAEGRIEGACKLGKTWMLPESSKKPSDERGKCSVGEDFFDKTYVTEQYPVYNSSAIYVRRNLFCNANKICEAQQIKLNDVVDDFLEQFIKNNSQTRIGIAEGAFRKCEDLNFCNAEVAKLFES